MSKSTVLSVQQKISVKLLNFVPGETNISELDTNRKHMPVYIASNVYRAMSSKSLTRFFFKRVIEVL